MPIWQQILVCIGIPVAGGLIISLMIGLLYAPYIWAKYVKRPPQCPNDDTRTKFVGISQHFMGGMDRAVYKCETCGEKVSVGVC